MNKITQPSQTTFLTPTSTAAPTTTTTSAAHAAKTKTLSAKMAKLKTATGAFLAGVGTGTVLSVVCATVLKVAIFASLAAAIGNPVGICVFAAAVGLIGLALLYRGYKDMRAKGMSRKEIAKTAAKGFAAGVVAGFAAPFALAKAGVLMAAHAAIPTMHAPSGAALSSFLSNPSVINFTNSVAGLGSQIANFGATVWHSGADLAALSCLGV